jgi:glutathione S-transferase
MAPTLHMVASSPAVRAVQITAKAIGLELKLKQLDFLNGEHLQSAYLKVLPIIQFQNKSQLRFCRSIPKHTVPTLVEDDGFTLWDSHAINAYLVSKYAKNDNLYPKDFEKEGAGGPETALRHGGGFRQRSSYCCEYFCD